MRIVNLLMALLLACSANLATADQTDKRLDALFARLKGTKTPDVARSVTSEIWSIWLHSGDRLSDELMRRGVTAMRAGRHNLALNQFELLVKHEPKFAEGWNKRATVLYVMGKFQSSIKDIKRVLVLEPRHFGALSGLGMCYEALGEEEAARDAYKLALNANPHLSRIGERIESLQESVRRKNIHNNGNILKKRDDLSHKL